MAGTLEPDESPDAGGDDETFLEGELPAIPAGDRLADRYQILEEIGRGGFALVLRARDDRLGRDVAVKVLRPMRDASLTERARFEREMKILAALDHPNIIPIYDAGLDGDRPFFTMKLATGPTLKDRIAEGPVPIAEALEVTTKLVDALEHAHAKGVLHRDIKPGNVLTDDAGRVLLADFGISRSHDLPAVTGQGKMIGTIQYMAPESMAGEAVAASDIFALGVVLHELVFGRRVHEAKNPVSLMYKIANEEPPLLKTPPAHVPAAVVRLLSTMLHRTVEGRPRNAGELARLVHETLREVSARRDHEDPISFEDTGISDALVAGTLQDLEEVVAAMERAARPDRPLPPVLELFSRFVSQARELLDHEPELGTVLAVQSLTNDVDAILESMASADVGSVAWSGYKSRLRNAVRGPASRLARRLERLARATQPDDDFFTFEGGAVESFAEDDTNWRQGLSSEDPIRQHEAVVHILQGGLESFLVHLGSQPEGERSRILWSLWNRADMLLIEGRGRSRAVIEAAIKLAPQEALQHRWHWLYALFRRGPGGYPPVSQVQQLLASYTPMDRQIVSRCLLLHPVAEMRTLGFANLGPEDCWEVVAHPDTAVGTLLEIWEHMELRVHDDLLKVFVVCTFDTLEMATEGPELPEVIQLVQAFYDEDVFHEDFFFGLLSRLDDRVREACAKLGVDVSIDEAYMEALREFMSTGSRPDQPVDRWRSVPLPVQRRIARRGMFLRHFSAHPLVPIAMETLPHLLLLEDVMPFIENRGINGRLLEEIAKEKRLFQREIQRYTLLANPKTPAHIVSRMIPRLRRDFLKKIAASRDCNQVARTHAQRLLGMTPR